MTLAKITYADKSNLNAPTDIPKQVTAGDLNEIKTVVNAIADDINSGSSTSAITEISLPSAASVALRIAGAVEGTDYPNGWVLTPGASAVDLNIEHGLNKRVASVTVFAVDGTEEQQLFSSAAYNGIKTPDSNNLLINSLATILKPIKIYILFV